MKEDTVTVVVASNLYYLCNGFSTLSLQKASNYSIEFFGLSKFLKMFYW